MKTVEGRISGGCWLMCPTFYPARLGKIKKSSYNSCSSKRTHKVIIVVGSVWGFGQLCVISDQCCELPNVPEAGHEVGLAATHGCHWLQLCATGPARVPRHLLPLPSCPLGPTGGLRCHPYRQLESLQYLVRSQLEWVAASSFALIYNVLSWEYFIYYICGIVNIIVLLK